MRMSIESQGPLLLRAAWPVRRVAERYDRYARALVEEGYTFGGIRRRDEVNKLVNERLTFDSPFVMTKEAGGINATAPTGELVGVVVIEASSFPNGILARVTAIAVDPRHERKGIGTVLLGMAPHLVTPTLIFGGCAASEAAFYQRAGYDVLQKDEALQLPVGIRRRFQSSNPHYPHLFARRF